MKISSHYISIVIILLSLSCTNLLSAPVKLEVDYFKVENINEITDRTIIRINGLTKQDNQDELFLTVDLPDSQIYKLRSYGGGEGVPKFDNGVIRYKVPNYQYNANDSAFFSFSGIAGKPGIVEFKITLSSQYETLASSNIKQEFIDFNANKERSLKILLDYPRVQTIDSDDEVVYTIGISGLTKDILEKRPYLFVRHENEKLKITKAPGSDYVSSGILRWDLKNYTKSHLEFTAITASEQNFLAEFTVSILDKEGKIYDYKEFQTSFNNQP